MPKKQEFSILYFFEHPRNINPPQVDIFRDNKIQITINLIN